MMAATICERASAEPNRPIAIDALPEQEQAQVPDQDVADADAAFDEDQDRHVSREQSQDRKHGQCRQSTRRARFASL